MTMKKKVYIKPEMKVYEIEPTVILTGSQKEYHQKEVLFMMIFLLRMRYVTIQDKGNTEHILFYSQVGGCKRHSKCHCSLHCVCRKIAPTANQNQRTTN